MEPQPIGSLKPGQPFRTCLTNRRGLILETRNAAREGVVVQMLNPPVECRLAPQILVEPRDEMEEDR